MLHRKLTSICRVRSRGITSLCSDHALKPGSPCGRQWSELRYQLTGTIQATTHQPRSVDVEFAEIAQRIYILRILTRRRFEVVADAADHAHPGERARVVRLGTVGPRQFQGVSRVGGLCVVSGFAGRYRLVELVDAAVQLAE